MPIQVARTGGNLPNGVFLPQIWSKKINSKFYAQCFLPLITNSDYEGEIKGGGSSVIIRNRPTVMIGDHIENDEITYQDIVDDSIELLINKAKRFAFQLGDIDKAQSDINIMNELTADAGYQMKIAIEKQVLGTIYADSTVALTQAALDKTNIQDWLVDAEVKMDENNLPRSNRWVVIPPRAAGLLQKSPVSRANEMGDAKSIIRQNMDYLGMIGGLDIFVSNNLTSSGSVTQCIAGHKSAVTFASQVVKVENLRLQTKFGDAVRGLNVYGYKTLLPYGLVSMPVTFA